jgi:Sulfotransferase domain
MNKELKDIDFIIIGGQKCGSTFIQSIISEHPDVFMPYDEQAYFEDAWNNQGEKDKLLSELNRSDGEKKIGIKRPSYLSKKECPSRIKSEVGTPKIIVILRNPIERIISAYYHYMVYESLPVEEINLGLKNLIDLKYEAQFARSSEILKFSFYTESLLNYIQEFGRENILILLHDDLRNERKNIVEKCYDFLGIDNSFHPEKSISRRPQKVIYSTSRLKMRVKYLNPVLFEFSEDRSKMNLAKMNFFEKAYCFSLDRFDNHVLSKIFDSKKPILNDDIKKKLIEMYSGDVENLENLLDRDLSSWMN